MPASPLPALLLLCLLGTAAPPLSSQQPAPPVSARVLSIGALTPARGPAALRDGLRFGAEEAARSAALFGWTVELHIHELAEGEDPQRALASRPLHALIVAGDDAGCRALTARLAFPVITIACASDELRVSSCSASAFHVSPSESMRSAARALATPGRDSQATGSVVAWDSTLERYGAAQLNDRFRARFARGATGDEWAAWIAVKAITEAAVRARTTAPAALAAGLASLTLDGHKGLPLTFRAWDGQLRQPLYVLGTGAEVAEVPARQPGTPARDLLDALSGPRPEPPCRPATPR